MSVQPGSKGNGSRALHPAGRDCFHSLHVNILLHVCSLFSVYRPVSSTFACDHTGDSIYVPQMNELKFLFHFQLLSGKGVVGPGQIWHFVSVLYAINCGQSREG